MLNLDQKQKFQRDISNYNVTIYPLVIIDNEINISTVNESLLDNETDKNPIIFKDYALKLSNIKESINVATHKFKISNVTLSFNNYEDSGQRLSDLMIGKISKQVVVYFKTQSCNYLSDCLIVYKGIIKRFNHDDSKISLTLEDLTDKVVHKDLPSANMNFGDHCLNKDLIDKYIPMTYGYVKKAPMIPYLNNNSTSSEGLLYLIPDDVDEITTSNRGICIEGFATSSEDSDSLNFLKELDSDGTFIENPLLIYKDDYYRVLTNYNPSFDRFLDEDDEGYPSNLQYKVGDTNNFIFMNREYLSGFAQNSTAIGELQTIKVWHPSYMTILSQEGETTVEGEGNSSIVNIVPDEGVFRPESAVDNINNPNSFSASEFESYAEIPNTQPTAENTNEEIFDLLPDGAGLRINRFEPYNQMYGYGMYYPKTWDLSHRTSFWKLVSSWLITNAHHFQGRVRLIQHPTSTMIFQDAITPLRESNLDIYGVDNWTGDGNNTFFVDETIAFQYNLQDISGNVFDSDISFKTSYRDSCSLTGDEQTELIASGHSGNYFDWNYQCVVQNDQGGGTEIEIDNLEEIFTGRMGNGGEGAPAYAPALLHRIRCNPDHQNNFEGIRTIYVGQWNDATMATLELNGQDRFINVFDDGEERPQVLGFIYDRNDFCSFFPLEQKYKNYVTAGGAGSWAMQANFSAIWNGVPINNYGDGGQFENESGGSPYVPDGYRFDSTFGFWGWHTHNNASDTLQDHMFTTHDGYGDGGQSWAIYIEDDIGEGEVLRKMSELEWKEEYYDNNTRTILKKGTVIPTTTRNSGMLNSNRHWDMWDWSMDEGYATTNNNVVLVEGEAGSAAERLAVTFPFSDMSYKDNIKTKTYVYGKFNVNIPNEEGNTHNVGANDNFLVDAVATDVLDATEQNFLNIVDPAYGVNLVDINGADSIFTDGGEIHWDCRPDADVQNNQFEALDDDDDNENTNSLISFELSGWDSPDAFNGLSLVFRLWSENNASSDKYMQVNTKINTLGILQFNIFEKVFDDNFYADIRGRANHPLDVFYDETTGLYEHKYVDSGQVAGSVVSKVMLENTCDIIYHIIEKELDQIDIMDRDLWKEFRQNIRPINLAFSVTDKINSKKLLEEIAKNSTIFPKFDNSGGFSFKMIKDEYTEADTLIKTDELIKIQFTRTPIENIHTLVNVKFNKDYAEDSLMSQTGYCDGYDFFGNGENGADVLMTASNSQNPIETKKGYDYSFLNLKREEKILEYESEYIRDIGSARKLRDYIYLFNCNQHTIIKCTLNTKNGIMLEVGDVVRFDKLYNNMKAYGEDYTSDDVYRNGQKIYPFFIITSVTKSTKNIKIECMQLHRLKPEFSAGLGSLSRGSQIGISQHVDLFWEQIESGVYGYDYTDEGWFDFNGHINLNDLDILENIVSNNYKYVTERQLLLADLSSDKSLDEYDLHIMATLISVAMLSENSNEEIVDESGDLPIPDITLGDVNSDGVIDVVDITQILWYILSPEGSIGINLAGADLNEDGFINVQDIITLIDDIFG